MAASQAARDYFYAIGQINLSTASSVIVERSVPGSLASVIGVTLNVPPLPNASTETKDTRADHRLYSLFAVMATRVIITSRL